MHTLLDLTHTHTECDFKTNKCGITQQTPSIQFTTHTHTHTHTSLDSGTD